MNYLVSDYLDYFQSTKNDSTANKVILMKILKTIVFLLFPKNLRTKIKLFIFKNVREWGLSRYLKTFGFSVYNKYIHLNHSTTDVILSNNNDIDIHKFSEADQIKPAVFISGEELPTLQPFIATTETVLLDIKNDSFSFRNNHLLDDKLNILGETRTIELDTRLPLPIYQQILSQPIKLKGIVAYLSDPDPGNYYHWMCRTLPLLRFYKNFLRLSEVDYFYVGNCPLSSFHEETLKATGILMSQVVQKSCTADRLLIAMTSRSLHLGNQINDPINQESYFFTRSLFLPSLKFSTTNKNCRIYVKRGDVTRRKIINEAEIINLLEKYGFEPVVMDNKTVQEQADLFSQAKAVVALHGAALTNLLFAQPGTKVIELAPFGYLNNCFYTLASHAKADYFYLQGEKQKQDSNDLRLLDTYIDTQKLVDTLQRASLDKVASPHLV
ncbi:MAG: glycosyltransferase family 61 protein [Scytonematopsis contorta HA4267-MV1]|jgi:hypothetical protein|nr:glycosyltransferase family 61 protein [Scytonematopsis contorta HA4267-MV1]